jgi:hypothetical protein
MLFTTKDLEQNAEYERMLSHPEKCQKHISPDIEADLDKALGNLLEDYCYHFDTGTKWSLHDIVVYIIKVVGASDVYLATWAIKTYQAGLITGMKAEGLIKSLHCLLDYRNPVMDKEAMQLLEENCTSLGLMRTHAKLTVIEGESLSAAIITSANYTNNTSCDVGVIITSKATTDYWKNWIIKNIEQNATK